MNQNTQMGSGLTRYWSAPSSYFASLGDVGLAADDLEGLFNPRSLSPETQTIFSRFMNSGDSTQQNCGSVEDSQFLGPAKIEPEALPSSEYTSEIVYQTQPPDYAPPDNGIFPQTKMPRLGGANSALIRHSSSPAGLFADINIQNEFGTRGGMDTITEIGSKGMGAVDDDMTGFPMNSWDDDFLRGLNDDDNKRADDQKSNRPTTLLSHHLSLPKSAMEKLLQDSVPCKIRAKRGCATHPRSIAERVRRTKISERMRKLQELVPNMEKQTNTSDMLDLAVDYIKDLQRQLKTLSDNREKCSCSEASDG